MADSFPCLVCGRVLAREFDEFEAQPRNGVLCRTRGNYGSRVFDDLIGEALDFNLCDPCLTTAGDQGRIFIQKAELPIRIDGCVVGWQSTHDRPHVPWRAGLPHDHSSIEIDPDELDAISKMETVTLHGSVDELKQSFQQEENQR